MVDDVHSTYKDLLIFVIWRQYKTCNAPRNRVPRLHRPKASGGLGSQNRGASTHDPTDAPRNRVPRLHRCKDPWPRFSEPGGERPRQNQRTPEHSSEATQMQGSSGLGSQNRGASAHGKTNAPRNRVPRLHRCKDPGGLGSQNRGASAHAVRIFLSAIFLSKDHVLVVIA